MERGLTVKKLSIMRKQHARLNRIMEGILKCDRILAIDQRTGPYLPFQNKYKRIRSRLYESYGTQLFKLVETIVEHGKPA